MRALTIFAAALQAAAVQRTTIRGHAVRRVDAIDGLFVYAVAYGGGSDGAPHDALATQLWPSARIAEGLVADAAPASMVEIGCGLALPSLAAARAGIRALATDRDPVALDFVSAAAADQNIDIATRVFDVEDASTALPPGDLVVLADVFVTDPVAEACAARCEEALRRGSDVLVVAAARSTRDAFLRALGGGSFGPAPARLAKGEGLWLVDGGAG
jgi:2-polyprenyl-3-methyl-5-hydroxy-6-metoxy-1,4-benzoquinol methylase